MNEEGRPMYGIMHMDGSGEDEPPVERLPDLYDELFNSGIFDGSVAVIDDRSAWCMSAHRNGALIFVHLDGEGGPFHMSAVPKERVVELWKRLVDGDVEGLLREPWRPGYMEK